MSDFPADRLADIDETMEVEIETRRDPGAPSHRVIIWVVVDAGEGEHLRVVRERAVDPVVARHEPERGVLGGGHPAGQARFDPAGPSVPADGAAPLCPAPARGATLGHRPSAARENPPA